MNISHTEREKHAMHQGTVIALLQAAQMKESF